MKTGEHIEAKVSVGRMLGNIATGRMRFLLYYETSFGHPLGYEYFQPERLSEEILSQRFQAMQARHGESVARTEVTPSEAAIGDPIYLVRGPV